MKFYILIPLLLTSFIFPFSNTYAAESSTTINYACRSTSSSNSTIIGYVTTPSQCARIIFDVVANNPVNPNYEFIGAQNETGSYTYYYNSSHSIRGAYYYYKEITSYQECTDPNYPVLSQDGQFCTEENFDLTSDISAFEENKSTLESQFQEIEQTNIDNENFKLNIDTLNDEMLNTAAQSSANATATESNYDALSELLSQNPDNLSLQALVAKADALSQSSQSEFSSILSVVEDSYTQGSNSTALVNSANSIYGFLQDGKEYYYGEGEKLYTVSSSSEAQTINSNLSTSFSDIQENITNFNNTTSQISTINNNVISNSSNVNNSSSVISDNYNQSVTTINNANTLISNGETCVSGNCITNPSAGDGDGDGEGEEEEESYPLPEHRESDYEGFQGAIENFYSGLQSTPLVSSFDSVKNIISYTEGACPVLTFDLSPVITQNVSTSIHCSLYEDQRTIISSLMYVVWIIGGFRILGSA